MLKKLDRLRLAGTFTSNRLKIFYLCQQLQLDHTPDLDKEEIPIPNDFLTCKNNSNLSDTPDNFRF